MAWTTTPVAAVLVRHHHHRRLGILGQGALDQAAHAAHVDPRAVEEHLARRR